MVRWIIWIVFICVANIVCNAQEITDVVPLLDNEDRKVENIWLDLYQPGVDFSSKLVPKGMYAFRGNLILEDWIQLGRSIPNLEKSLSNFVIEFANDSKPFPISKRHIRLENAVVAIALLGVEPDRSLTLFALDKEWGKSEDLCRHPFPISAISALGLIADDHAVAYLEKVAVSKKVSSRYSDKAIWALEGEALETFAPLMNIDKQEKNIRLKRLISGLERVRLGSSEK